MVLWSQGNKDWYPGLSDDGTVAMSAITATRDSFGTASSNGAEPIYRIALMMRGNYFSPEYLLSPAETNAKKLESPAKVGVNMTSDQFSYAMLRIDVYNNARRMEWRASKNAEAAVISDRNLGAGAGRNAYSNNTAPEDGWRGSIGFNDNHAIFGVSNVLTNTYLPRAGSIVGKFTTTLDDLFADDKDNAGRSGNDAAMVHQDAVTYVNQN